MSNASKPSSNAWSLYNCHTPHFTYPQAIHHTSGLAGQGFTFPDTRSMLPSSPGLRRRRSPPEAGRFVQPHRREDRFMASMNRRQFLKVTGTSLAGSSMAALGMSPGTAMAEVRQYKLARMTETRNTCPYCSVACGLLMYGLGDGAKNAKASIVHIEGDPD